MTHNRFTHALVRMPVENMGEGLTTQHLGQPDFTLALQEYEHYLTALRASGLEVTILPADPTYPDGHFVEDTAVIYEDLAVITHPGANSRQGETTTIEAALPQTNRVHITEDACLEGGDVLFCADRILIGLSKRTNRAGAEQLQRALLDYDTSLKVELVPFTGVLHLKTGMTEIAPGVLLRSPEFISAFAFDFAEVIPLPYDESYSANVIPINNSLLIPAGFPTASRLAAQYSQQVIEIPMSEFAKMDGGLTCLSLRYKI